MITAIKCPQGPYLLIIISFSSTAHITFSFSCKLVIIAIIMVCVHLQWKDCFAMEDSSLQTFVGKAKDMQAWICCLMLHVKFVCSKGIKTIKLLHLVNPDLDSYKRA